LAFKVLEFGKQNFMVDNVEGLFEVDKQGTNKAQGYYRVCSHLY